MKRLFLISSFLLTSLAAYAADVVKPVSTLSADDALRAYQTGGLTVFAKQLEDALRDELGQKKLRDEPLIRLASLRAFANRVGPAKLAAAEDAATLAWVVKHPTLGPMLLTALSPRDNPARVIAVLTALRAKFGKALEQYPDLTVATCVVWDSPSREGQTPEQATQAACAVFGHLMQNRALLRVDPKLLPWPVLLYLVDSKVSPDERQWAISSYRMPADPARAYFQVHYDTEGYLSGQWRGGGADTYTLPNILRLGGVCKDEAHFAAEVSRAYGIPAVVCTGSSGGGEGFHAWVGLLRAGPRRVVWDFNTARYSEHGFWSGAVIDPQTGQRLADSEVAMSAEWCAAAPGKRLLSLALAQSLDLLSDQAQRITVCKAALEASPGNAQAWMTLIAECARAQTPAPTVREVATVVERFAVGRYDDFAFKSLTALIAPARPDEQLTMLDRAAKLFPDRPDLLAELALRKGDALRKDGKVVDALRLYEQVLEVALKFGPIALDAIARVDAMLRPAGKMRELVEHYRVAWTHMAAPEPTGYAATTPWYIMGERYAAILEESGEKGEAERVRSTIYAKDLSRGKGDAPRK